MRIKNIVRKIALYLLTGVLALLAFGLLRWLLKEQIGFDWPKAVSSGFWLGIQYDAGVIILIAALGFLLFGIIGIPRRLTWLGGLAFFYAISVADLLYFTRFAQQMNWWVFRYHRVEVANLLVDKLSMLRQPVGVASLIVLGIAVILPFIINFEGKEAESISKDHSYFNVLGASLTVTLLLGSVSWAAFNYPKYEQGRGGGIANSLALLWLGQIFDFNTNNYSAIKQSITSEEESAFWQKAELLARYRSLPPEGEFAGYEDIPLEPPLLEPKEKEWPLWAKLLKDDKFSCEMRELIGVSCEKDLNIIVVFAEALRAFEYLKKDTATFILPKTSALFKEKALLFAAAYSEALSAGQAARAQFSTSCSLLSDNNAAATFFTHTTLRAACLPELLHDAGYLTALMTAYDSSAGSMRAFEMLHGTDRFFDEDYYISRGVSERIDSRGLEDGPFLAETVKILGELAKENKPLYANIHTLPAYWTSKAAVDDLPEIIRKRGAGHQKYLEYLARLKALDQALDHFFTVFFSLPMADNSVVILLGDHSPAIEPYHQLSDLQKQELTRRIPLAVITKNMPRPLLIPWPVQQIDIAPTVARLAKAEGEVAWLGRGLLARPGSPFMADLSAKDLSFRTGRRACYTLLREQKVECYLLNGKDPLLDELETPLPPDQEFIDYIREFYIAIEELIAANKIYPLGARP